ncbi:MAG: radical SAM-associated putative lipoprotein, partial [Bacteroidetes bacterium]|nr:radical SAM-associated putative lipoprotein [Bacteroidota bacterium]
MKKLSRVCNKGTLWVLSGLLSLLGFSECDRFPGKVEYGTPRADFIVSGKVTDVEDRTLPQIRVVVPRIVQKLDPRAGVIW